jgi:RHS repeat-associated protein
MTTRQTYNNHINGEGFCCTDKSSKMTTLDSNIGNGNDDPEKLIFFYHSDHLGSTSYVTNLDGDVVQHVEYIPFGEVFLEERNNTWNTPYLFNSKELDEETGLYYYGARYYNPRESVWLSVDPLVEKTGTPYQYCYQNPVKFVDPLGMEGEDWVKREKNRKTEYFYDPNTHGKEATEAKYGKGSYMGNGEGTVSSATNGEKDGRYQYNLNAGGSVTDKNGNPVNERIHTDGGSIIYQYCETCLDPRTLYNNLLGLTYPGGKNPQNYLEDDDYSYGLAEGMSPIEIPGIIHDKRYDALGIKGLSGLLSGRSAISADHEFVKEQYVIGLQMPGLSLKERVKSMLLGYGLGMLATPKTLYDKVAIPLGHPYSPEQKGTVQQGQQGFSNFLNGR